MTVIFEAKASNRYTINNLRGIDDDGNELNFGQQVFRKGVKMTSDKELIKALLQNEGYRRGDFQLITNKEIVADYLDGTDTDKITKKVLDNITIEGIKELGRILGTKNEQPTLIKIEIVGSPITSRVRDVLDYYETNQNKPQKSESEIKEFESPHSMSMNVRDALKYIKETPNEELKNFISEDEDRKTILQAYKLEMDN